MIMHPFISDWVCIRGRIIPKVCFGFPGTYHRTVLSYYGCQVGEVCNFAETYGVEDSDVRAVVTEERNCVLLTAVLYPVHNQEESGPIVVYCFPGLLPYLG